MKFGFNKFQIRAKELKSLITDVVEDLSWTFHFWNPYFEHQYSELSVRAECCVSALVLCWYEALCFCMSVCVRGFCLWVVHINSATSAYLLCVLLNLSELCTRAVRCRMDEWRNRGILKNHVPPSPPHRGITASCCKFDLCTFWSVHKWLKSKIIFDCQIY